LLKVVLQNIMVYWLSLLKVPHEILHKIRQVMFHVLWLGAKEKNEFHLVYWEQISRPKELGGWGVRNIFWFARALALKILWQVLFGCGLWSRVTKIKYLKGLDVVFWLNPRPKYTSISVVWRFFMEVLPLLKLWLVWNGTRILVGQDPFVGGGYFYIFLKN